MRDLLITAIVLGILPMALRHPWAGVLLWTWLSIMNPHRLAWGFAHDAPFAAMAAGATLVGLWVTKDKRQLPSQGTTWLLIAFMFWMFLTTLFAMDLSGSWDQLVKVFKIQLMTVVALLVLHEKKHIQWFVWVNALSIGFYGLKGGIFTVATAGEQRVWGPGGFIGGNNEIGLAILISIPLLYCLYLTSAKRWVRNGLMATMVFSAIAVLGTQSRGAFLAIAGMSLFLWWRAPRKLLSGVAITLSAVVALAVMSEAFIQRMETIRTYEQDHSAMGRIHAWQTAINIANSRPLGAGFDMYEQGVFLRYAPRDNKASEMGGKAVEARAAHSIYFQVLGEHGWVGLILFLAIGVSTWRNANRLRRQTKGDKELQWIYHLAGMSQVSMVGFAIGGAFLSLAYFDLPFNVMVMIVVCQRWLAAHVAERKTLGAAASSPASPGALAAAAPQRRLTP
jgi:putative inorganic carbon (HCO3(-)) transporter